jgi:hypothetical protein
VEEDTKSWKGLSYSWTRRINIKISMLSKVIYRFNDTPMKITITKKAKLEVSKYPISRHIIDA